MAGLTATYVDPDTFTVADDLTENFIPGRRVKTNCGVDGDRYGTILNSSFSTVTTVNLTTDSDSLTSNLTEAWFGLVGSEDSTQSLPDHSHDGGPASGGLLERDDFWKGINLFDNAAMQVCQRNSMQNLEGVITASVDRWFMDKRGKAEHSSSQGTTQPNIAEDGYLGNIDEDWGCFMLQMSVSRATDTIQSTDYGMFGQRIPKSKMIPLMQDDFTISFYMRASLSGVYCLSLRNPGISTENLANCYLPVNQDTDQQIGGSFYDSVGQNFRSDAVNRGELTKASFLLRKVLLPTGTAVAELYEMDGQGFNTLPTGSAIATSDTLDVSTLTTSYVETEFTFSDGYEFIPNKMYSIVVTYSGGDGTNYLEIGTQTSGTHNGRTVRETGGWSSVASECTIFTTYETSLAPDRYYIAEITVNSGLTWERKEVTIPKIDPSVGTWGLGLASNIGDAGDSDEVGLIISLCQFAGSSWRSGTADAWTTGNQIATSNQINSSDQTSGRQIRLYQPKLEIGDTATDFYIQSFDEQIAIAQRHMETLRTFDDEVLCMGETLTTTTSRFVLPLISKRAPVSLSMGKINDSIETGYDIFTQGNTYAVSKIRVVTTTKNNITLEVTHATVPSANFMAYLKGDGSQRQIDFDAII